MHIMMVNGRMVLVRVKENTSGLMVVYILENGLAIKHKDRVLFTMLMGMCMKVPIFH